MPAVTPLVVPGSSSHNSRLHTPHATNFVAGYHLLSGLYHRGHERQNALPDFLMPRLQLQYQPPPPTSLFWSMIFKLTRLTGLNTSITALYRTTSMQY